MPPCLTRAGSGVLNGYDLIHEYVMREGVKRGGTRPKGWDLRRESEG